MSIWDRHTSAGLTTDVNVRALPAWPSSLALSLRLSRRFAWDRLTLTSSTHIRFDGCGDGDGERGRRRLVALRMLDVVVDTLAAAGGA